MTTLLIVLSIFAVGALYKRYYPVKGVVCFEGLEDCKDDRELFIVDVRDFQEATKKPVENSLNIPYAYLKRYNKDIPRKKLILVADTELLANVATRFLRGKGFKVAGVHFIAPSKKDKRRCCQWEDIALTPKKQIN